MKLPAKVVTGICAVCVVASGYIFSDRSKLSLKDVDIRLQEVAQCALQHTTTDFVVVDGHRTAAEHKNNVAAGRSWIKRSKHQDGLAIDIAALNKGKVTYNPAKYYNIAEAFYYCSDSMGIPIIWGGEWRVQDLMHYELK